MNTDDLPPSKAHNAAALAPAETLIREVVLPVDGVELDGQLVIPPGAGGIVLFAHGSGSSRHSSRNRFVARRIQAAGLGTLLFDLLTGEEERADASAGEWRFNIELLTGRLAGAAQWIRRQPEMRRLGLGFLGASTGAAAALAAAADLGPLVQAVVSRGGRPDLARSALPLVTAPTLLLVGQFDRQVLELNHIAFAHLRCEKRIAIVPGATHLFEEPGAMEEVAALATAWFFRHLEAHPAIPA